MLAWNYDLSRFDGVFINICRKNGALEVPAAADPVQAHFGGYLCGEAEHFYGKPTRCTESPWNGPSGNTGTYLQTPKGFSLWNSEVAASPDRYRACCVHASRLLRVWEALRYRVDSHLALTQGRVAYVCVWHTPLVLIWRWEIKKVLLLSNFTEGFSIVRKKGIVYVKVAF